ncbi:hypothetical protein PYCCODRAFT_616927 [Trametes coccinea BRFM310]|uniref:Uncharacterized protein n=1 Tax=Trametes coccinea (strain BRFM310) TaxID=1353009 RepID=A0A1Y2J2D2_TRAC3|nr:hypothetical protein PYCCODRAFT_616927 [Trametes coccinea BRFM310]
MGKRRRGSQGGNSDAVRRDFSTEMYQSGGEIAVRHTARQQQQQQKEKKKRRDTRPRTVHSARQPSDGARCQRSVQEDELTALGMSTFAAIQDARFMLRPLIPSAVGISCRLAASSERFLSPPGAYVTMFEPIAIADRAESPRRSRRSRKDSVQRRQDAQTRPGFAGEAHRWERAFRSGTS